MKAHVKSQTGRIVVEVESDTVKGLFEQLAAVQEILDPDPACGACNSGAVKLRVRTIGKYKYYEMHCESCTASLSYGQQKEGGALFPHRKDKRGNELPNRGWIKYQPGPRGEER